MHSENSREYPEDTVCSSETKHIAMMNNLDEAEFPNQVRGRRRRKMRLQNVFTGSSGALASQEYKEKLSTLQQLMENEQELKIDIAYEKLRKEEPVILDEGAIYEKIGKYKKLLEEARSQHKSKKIMHANLQLTNTLQRIVGKPGAAPPKSGFSDSQRKCVEDLLKKKKELTKSISIKRKEIARIDEDVLKLGKSVPITKENKNTKAKMENHKELERLKSNNKKVADRIHFLSHIIQSLIPHTEEQEDSDLSELMAECEKVSESPLDNLDDIKTLLEGVCSHSLQAEHTQMDCSIYEE